MGAINALVGKVYFEGDVQMPVPPEYFLQRLYDYDAMLVMFPSAVRAGTYVLARRRERTPGLTSAALAIVANPDTRLCMAMGWVPVCAMFQTGASWNPDQIIARLKARDIRAIGGADKAADLLEEQEDAEKAAQKAATREDLWNRSGDGWRTYQARTGASSHLFHETPPRTPVMFVAEGGAPPESSMPADHPAPSPVPEATVSTASTPRSTAGLGAESATIGGEV